MGTLILLLLIIATILLIAFIPTLISLTKAKKAGAKIDFQNALQMKIRKILDGDIISAIALVQRKNLPITNNLLEAHKLAGGNALKCVEGFLYAKEKNIDVDFQELTLANLTNNDIIEIIDFTTKPFKVEINSLSIRDSKLRNLIINYSAEFTTTFGSACFNRPDKDKIEKEIIPKIERFVERSDSSNLINSGKIITESILDTSFWETKGLNLVRQELTIR